MPCVKQKLFNRRPCGLVHSKEASGGLCPRLLHQGTSEKTISSDTACQDRGPELAGVWKSRRAVTGTRDAPGRRYSFLFFFLSLLHRQDGDATQVRLGPAVKRVSIAFITMYSEMSESHKREALAFGKQERANNTQEE